VNREQAELDRFLDEQRVAMTADLTATRVRATFAPMIDLTELAGALLVIGSGTWALAAGRISLGGLLVFLTYLAQLFRPVRDLSHLATTVYSASAGAERIIEFLDAQPPVRDRAGALELDRVRGEVEFEASPSATRGRRVPPSATYRSRCSPARPSRWSARAGRGSRRSRSCCCACSTRTPARCASTGTICAL
jgi:ABC-type multidrug transport system fused ATPase/permease subunit